MANIVCGVFFYIPFRPGWFRCWFGASADSGASYLPMFPVGTNTLLG